MEIQGTEARIREIDETILKVCDEFAGELRARAPLRALEERVRFLRVLFRRRDCMLSDYAEKGGDVKGLYTFEAAIGGEKDG